MPFRVGIDLCDEYIDAYDPEQKKLLTFPAAICHGKWEDVWYIGEEAYRMALSGKGVLTDKLLSLLSKDGTSTIGEWIYNGADLISKLIEIVSLKLLNISSMSEISKLVISLRKVQRKELDAILCSSQKIGVARENIVVISHEEAFVHYMLSQDRELRFNMVGLFDLSGESLSFYRMKMIRGTPKVSAVADSTDVEETFSIGITNNESGSLMGDRMLLRTAQKFIAGDIYSSVLLTGEGFENTSWAKNFLQFICKKRRVIYEAGLFSVGAAVYAEELDNKTESYCIIYCDTRTHQNITLDVSVNNQQAKLIMVPSGIPWYEVNTYAEVLPRGQSFIDIDIDFIDKLKPKKTIRIELNDFPKRPDRCTRVAVEIKYQDISTLNIKINDLGFGDIFPSSFKSIEKTVSL